eukprot:scaffold25224_cov33-Tisochrysis_lutea.AAC.2
MYPDVREGSNVRFELKRSEVITREPSEDDLSAKDKTDCFKLAGAIAGRLRDGEEVSSTASATHWLCGQLNIWGSPICPVGWASLSLFALRRSRLAGCYHHERPCTGARHRQGHSLGTDLCARAR